MMKEFGRERASEKKKGWAVLRVNRGRRRKKGKQFTTEIIEWCNEEQRQRTKETHQGELKVLHG